jgi:hypothetical protein
MAHAPWISKVSLPCAKVQLQCHLFIFSERSLIGVLNFDSDEDLLGDFAKLEIQQVAIDCANVMCKRLTT